MATSSAPDQSRHLLISYMSLRKLVGLIGIFLPFVLMIGGKFLFNSSEIESSISHYYHTGMRDVFVGLLIGIAMFLFCYKGPEKIDGIIGNLAGAFATGVAVFPTTPNDALRDADTTIGFIHFICATLFFLSLAYFSMCLFTKSKPDAQPTPRKLLRNKVYRVCGILMLFFLVCIFLYFQIFEERFPTLKNYSPVFWLESFALWAFGFSWITKGEMILGDLK